jgi:hypothetical protein
MLVDRMPKIAKIDRILKELLIPPKEMRFSWQHYFRIAAYISGCICSVGTDQRRSDSQYVSDVNTL